MRVAIIGVGNLGSAIAEGLLRAGVTSQGDLLLVERGTKDREAISARFGAVVFDSEGFTPAADLDALIVAVKPSDGAAVCNRIASTLSPHTLVVSVMAGVTLDKLTTALNGHDRVARCMPNLGARVGKSATAYFLGSGVGSADTLRVQAILAAFGSLLQVEREELIDAATALAGSGPAYVCWLAEQMTAEGVDLGFSPEEATMLVQTTLEGTAEYLMKHPTPFEELRAQVTSPKGTTAAALEHLQSREVAGGVRRAIRAAFDRARELGKA